MNPLDVLKTTINRCIAEGSPVYTEKTNTLTVGGKYNWRNQPERLIYLGKARSWHQFKKIGDPREVWCEVLDADLHMIEATAVFSKYTGPVPLDETSIDHIPNDEQNAYWVSINESEGTASDEDFDRLYSAWYEVQTNSKGKD